MHPHNPPPPPTKPILSVLTLTIDRPKLLQEAAESIKYEPVEWVVVDGSKDAETTFKAFCQVRGKFYHSVYAHVPPTPPLFPIGVARNVALKIATGKYCVILDDDDVFLSEWPRVGVEYLEGNPLDKGVYANTYLGDSERQIGEIHNPVTPLKLLERGNFLGTSAVVWRHRPEYRHEEKFWCCDPYDLWIQVAAGSIGYLPVKAFINRLNRLPNSASEVYSCPECYRSFREITKVMLG